MPLIDPLIENFYIPQFRRYLALIAGEGTQERYSPFNLAKGVVSWALRSGDVEFQGRTLRSGKVPINKKQQFELLAKLQVANPNVEGLEAVLRQVLNELYHYEKINDDVAKVGPWDGTWYSDSVIPTQLKEELDNSATHLEESIPNAEKDWHYGGDNLVLNLVHPSLYCVNAETTRILKKEYRPEMFNIKHDYNKLLQHVENAFVPPEEVKRLLSSYDNHNDFYLRGSLVSSGVRFSSEEYLDKDYQWLASDVFVNEDGVARFGSYINNLFDSQVAQNVETILSKMIPLFERTLNDLRKESRITNNNRKETVVKLSGRKIQVIVTMSNIILTPQKPKYPGGRLHVDGMDNEQTVAVGIFYYSCKNITESRLALSDKKIVHLPVGSSFETVSLGSIETKEGRCFVFPNNIQHQVLPFELADPTVPGHRKRLTFFLVDPSISIISSARVPPQQKYCWVTQLKGIFAGIFPPEVVDHIGSFCISQNYPELKIARENRDNMAKRRTFQGPSSYFPPQCGD